MSFETQKSLVGGRRPLPGPRQPAARRKILKILSPFFSPPGDWQGADSIRRVGKGIARASDFRKKIAPFSFLPSGSGDSGQARQAPTR
jgi:hypothetical protein